MIFNIILTYWSKPKQNYSDSKPNLFSMVTRQYKARRYSLVLLKLQTMTEEFERNPGAT